MNSEKANKWIEEEEMKYGEVFSKITFAIDDIIPFKEGTDIEERYFIKNIKLLDTYINMLNSAKSQVGQKKKVLFFDVDKLSSEELESKINGLELFKDKYEKNINKLVKCSNCKCLKCVRDCKFKSCLSCGAIGNVMDCDKETYAFMKYFNNRSKLYNSETNSYDDVKVLGAVYFSDDDKDYRLIESNGESLILTYKNVMGTEEYGAVTDTERFNKVADLYERNVGY